MIKIKNLKSRNFLILLIFACFIIMPACAEDLNSVSTIQLSTKEKLLLDSYKKNPNNITVNLDLAKLYFNGGIKDKAVFYLNNAKKIDNTNSEVYAIGSDILFNEGLVREAEIAARKSVAYGEECAYSYIIMGKIYLKKSESPELLNSFFAASKKQRLLTQSKKYFLKALELDEKNAQAHIGLSNYYKATENDFKRQDELMKAEELDIYNPQTLIFLAEFCIDNARFQKALNYLEKADNFSLTKQYQVHYLMGNIYEKLGDFFKAQHEYYTVLEMKPFDSEVKQRIEQINDVIAGIPSKKVVTDEINEANNEEKTVKAYFFIITDRETEARQMLLEVLKDNPDNIKAIQGIAELYYTQWLTGEFTLRNYIADSEYFSSVEDYDKIKIALIKNNIISSQGISQQLKEIISNLSNKFEFDEQNALIDSFRASNLNDDFLNAKKKLDLLLRDGLSDDFVFQLTAYLCFDRNYDLAKETLKIISNSKKYSTWASLISDRIARKLETADKNCETGLENYRKKDYSGAIFVFEQNLKFYSTHKRTHIYYALALNKMGNSQKAIEELKEYIILESIFPSEKLEFKVSDLQKMITTWKK